MKLFLSFRVLVDVPDTCGSLPSRLSEIIPDEIIRSIESRGSFSNPNADPVLGKVVEASITAFDVKTEEVRP